MKSRNLAVLAILCLTIGRALSAQSYQSSALSLQGFSGILNTPTGHVQEQGTFDAIYSNQKDSVPGKVTYNWQNDYIFSAGMFSFAEVGARLTNTVNGNMYLKPAGIRDLAPNVKLSTAPLTARFRFSPALAVGMEDLYGSNHFFRTSYGAASADPVGWLRLSAGYGHGPSRMKGAFGGMELRANDWVTLLGEYDTVKINGGVRLTSPALPYIPARLTATVSRPTQPGQDLVISAGLAIPLDFSKAKRVAAGRTADSGKQSAPKTLWGALTAKKVAQLAPEPTPLPLGVQSQSRPADSTDALVTVKPARGPCCENNEVEPVPLEALRDQLIKAGFVNVRVGLLGKTLVVEYENIRYNHTELDAVGVVAGIASQAAGTGPDQLQLVVKRKGLALLQIGVPLLPLRDWLEGDALANAPAFTVTQRVAEDGVGFLVGEDNPGRLKPSVMVYPSITTLVGTEFGLFDYQLSIKPELQVPLWPGATGVARWDIPIAWSHNLESGQPYASYHTPAKMDRLMLFQALPLVPGLVANLGGGEILDTTFGTLNELSWTPGSGMHRFNTTQSWGRDTSSNLTRNVLLGSYRFLLAREDLALDATGGRFWGQDTGVLVNLKRFFGDRSISLYYSSTVKSGASSRWQKAGIELEIPLTPRRDMAARPFQIRGNGDWIYGQETVIAASDEKLNYIATGLATVPETTQSLSQYFYDQERLNSEYILSHTERIKEGWLYFHHGL